MSARRRCLPRFTRRGLWGALLLAVATFNIVLLRSRAFAPTAARPSAARGSAAPRPPPSASPEPAPATTAVPRPRHNVPEPDHDDGGSAGHVRRYNVVWASPSNSSAGSMPLGNGDVALNVWVTGDGAVHLLISKADAFDENHSLLKLALVSVTLRPSPFRAGPFFNQTLDLLTGTVYADLGGAGRGDTQAAVRVWVDAHSPTVNVQVHSLAGPPLSVSVALVSWRNRTAPLFQNWLRAHCEPRSTSPDVVVSAPPRPELQEHATWYHRNTPSFLEALLEHQRLAHLKARFADAWKGWTFGGTVHGPALRRVDSHTLQSVAAAVSHTVQVTVHARRTETVEQWFEGLVARLPQSAASWSAHSVQEHESWWSQFWSRSYIHISVGGDGAATAHRVSQQYALQRYLEACSSRGALPIKFNGGLFTADAAPGPPSRDADYRRWGGGFWWQNTRLPYWGMLQAGDWDLMRPLFDMYSRMLPLARARTHEYFNHSGAYFPEITNVYGMFANGGWGYGCAQNRRPQWPPHQIENVHTRYEFQGGLELVWMMLDFFHFTQSEAFLQGTLLPMARDVLAFYAEHFPSLDRDGKMVITPAQGLETWLCVTLADCTTNPVPEVAGLRVVLPALLDLPAGVDARDREAWRRLLAKTPAVVLEHGVIAPAQRHPRQTQNQENVELYAVHPYRWVTATEPENKTLLRHALQSYDRRQFQCNRGWCQDVLVAALLGKAQAAMTQVVHRARTPPPAGWRFPGFMPAFHDWHPNMEHLAVSKTALQLMAMQYHLRTRRIYVLPAWPCAQWDVDLQLQAPGNTTVRVRVRDGRVVGLRVWPPHRREDVVVVRCQ